MIVYLLNMKVTQYSSARAIMSNHLGRALEPDEWVCHKEGYSNELSNLVLLTKEEAREFIRNKIIKKIDARPL